MIEHGAPSRHHWLPSALPLFFGAEPEAPNPYPGHLDVISEISELSGEICSDALNNVAGLGDGDLDVDLVRGALPSQLHGDAAPPGTAMRVVMIGRTMAGKSSLLSALAGGYRERIGNGRQRVTTDVLGAPIRAAEHIEVVDTPGVGAYDGVEDFEKALEAAVGADLILWVASSDSIQEETARALRLLGVIGKPIVVALNCRQSLDGVGRLKLLKFPEQVFGNKDGLLNEISRHMSDAAVEPLAVVHVHALAAATILADGSPDPELHAASRMDDLIDVLVREHRLHSQSRRVLRLMDEQRLRLDGAAMQLAIGAQTLQANAHRSRTMAADVHARLSRVLRSAEQTLLAEVDCAIGRRRDWHLTVRDFGDSLPTAWQAEVSELQTELQTTLERGLSSLAETMGDTIESADAEWSDVSPEQFALGDLAGFNEVWGNRLLRAGIGVGGGLAAAWAGAEIGGAIGLAGGPLAPFAVPIGIVLGGAMGFAAPLVLEPLKRLVAQIFLGKDGVLRKRRDQVAVRIGPILDDLSERSSERIGAHMERLREFLESESDKSDQRSGALDLAAAQWSQHSEALQSLIRQLDKETTTTLLRVQGRERLAREVRHVTRVPGVCILTEFEPVAFSEAWLFPPDLGERLVAGRPGISGGEAAASLSYGLGLLDQPVTIARTSDSSATLRVHASVPDNITLTWADALTRHIGKDITIETARRARSI